MPNYCTNIVRGPKKVLEELYDKGNITFQKLIPMPKELDITTGDITEQAITYAIYKRTQEEFLKIKKIFESIEDSYYSNLWNKYKDNFTLERIKEIEKNAKNYVPEDSEKKLGIKTLEDFRNLMYK